MRELSLDQATLDHLREHLPRVADAAVSAIIAEVPAYTGALSGPMGGKIRNAVQLALGGFISLATRTDENAVRRPTAAALEGSYQLGRGEARSGRPMEALLAAYRVGARVSWREMSRDLVADGVGADVLATFAELVFAYIDQLSASSVAGHTDERESTGRVRQQQLESLARGLVLGEPPEVLARLAEEAEWVPPERLVAVLVPEDRVRRLIPHVDPRVLVVAAPDDPGRSLLLVPDAPRAVLARQVGGGAAVLGPARAWAEVRASVRRARRAALLEEDAGVVDTETVLVPLVLHADDEALQDLRDQVLAPLQDLPDSSRAKLVETLRAWLLHRGRRDAVAEALFVHPQTVRYRVGQLREHFGERLEEPEFVAAATVALVG